MSAVKHDQKKAPMDLLPYESLEAIAEVLGFGAKKYARGNWLKGIEYSRLISAAQRHIGQFNAGQDKDEESELSHLAHAGCCILFLLYMEKHRKDMDDRCFKGAPVVVPSQQGLVVKEGRRYRRRDGVITYAAKPYLTCEGPGFILESEDSEDRLNRPDGRHLFDEDEFDLVEELS